MVQMCTEYLLLLGMVRAEITEAEKSCSFVKVKLLATIKDRNRYRLFLRLKIDFGWSKRKKSYMLV